MEYLSTRGEDNNTTFEGVLLNGLARDGGLYLPNSWPTFNSSEPVPILPSDSLFTSSHH